jgi:hypothetical protein
MLKSLKLDLRIILMCLAIPLIFIAGEVKHFVESLLTNPK